MRPILLIALLSAAAGTTRAEFIEKPVQAFSPEWKIVKAAGAKGLTCREDKGALLVDGFHDENKAKIKLTEIILEHPTKPCQGDFTATLDLEYDQIDRAFMGGIKMQVLDEQGKIIVEGGFIDPWLAAAGRAYAGLNGEKNAFLDKTMPVLPLRASAPFIVERRGKEITVRLRNWKFLQAEGSASPAAAIRLVFQRYRHSKDGHFGSFRIREVSLVSGTKPIPAYQAPDPVEPWVLKEPIIWYWAGPEMSDEFAAELKAGGWNTAFGRTVFDLDTMQKHGLKGVLWMGNPDTPENIVRLKYWLESIRHHPALLGVSCGDEPGGIRMLKAQKRVEFIMKHAPELLHFNNMYPCGASNKQLGHEGLPIPAYEAYIREYFEKLKPQLLSYDHYTFFKRGDRGSYFNNQAMVRKAALEHGIPSMNIVQGAAWTMHIRVPTPNEYRYLAYTSLAYGSQGLSCYVYSYKKHWGSMRDPETGKTGKLYEAAKSINREFYNIAKELRPFRSLHAYHTGEIPYGVETLVDSCVFQIEPKLKNFSQGLTAPQDTKLDKNLSGQANSIFSLRPPVTGWVLGVFGRNGKASHVLVVNLDYKKNAKTVLTGPGKLERFDPLNSKWNKTGTDRVPLDVLPGSGVLLRLAE